ncbi:hypothetical protein ACTQ4E_10215 [Lawsonibacter sp. LCP25S3_G6]|uniref:hypothetical protein n=1 Tax=unclassified Lawsonibacter TaxID=2617946 RepID=UPI003F9CDDE3
MNSVRVLSCWKFHLQSLSKKQPDGIIIQNADRESKVLQERYWRQITQFKFELCYLANHFAEYVKINREIKIGVAVASSSAIAAWAIWTELSFVWGLIIVVGQVVSAINEVLPYQQRIKDIAEMQSRLNAIYIPAEQKWFDVSNGYLSEPEINDLYYQQLKEWEEIDQEYFTTDALPKNDRCATLAEDEKNRYFKNRFGVGD